MSHSYYIQYYSFLLYSSITYLFSFFTPPSISLSLIYFLNSLSSLSSLLYALLHIFNIRYLSYLILLFLSLNIFTSYPPISFSFIPPISFSFIPQYLSLLSSNIFSLGLLLYFSFILLSDVLYLSSSIFFLSLISYLSSLYISISYLLILYIYFTISYSLIKRHFFSLVSSYDRYYIIFE